ncbi:hypothetical protein CLIM01_14941, partial [Colletotrichum limetticola]
FLGVSGLGEEEEEEEEELVVVSLSGVEDEDEDEDEDESGAVEELEVAASELWVDGSLLVVEEVEVGEACFGSSFGGGGAKIGGRSE